MIEAPPQRHVRAKSPDVRLNGPAGASFVPSGASAPAAMNTSGHAAPTTQQQPVGLIPPRRITATVPTPVPAGTFKRALKHKPAVDVENNVVLSVAGGDGGDIVMTPASGGGGGGAADANAQVQLGGGGGGRTADGKAPLVPSITALASDVGVWLSALGASYAPYAKAAVDNNLDGSLLHAIAREPTFATASELLAGASITNKLHQRLILAKLGHKSSS